MTHIPELDQNCYFATGPRLRAIGWLESGKEFEIGSVDGEFLDRLKAHLHDPFGLVDFCGSHVCSLCAGAFAPHGNCELIVPTEEVCYVAPALIAHYVEAHRYRPPAAFIEALVNCPPQKSASYMARIAPFLNELNNVA